VIVERGEEGHSHTAVSHGVQETVAGGCQKEINPQGKPTQAGCHLPKSGEHHNTRQESGKRKRVREPPVAPEVTVADAESEADHVKVGNYGAKYARDPNPT